VDDTTSVKTRRRGAELERAILRAAWEQLVAEGYSRFSIESVADRARTSKHVIYRRWSDREERLRATIRNRGAERETELPDTGSLRLDMLTALRNSNSPQNDMAVLLGALLGSLYGDLDMTPAQVREELLGDRASVTRIAIDRAVERGEVDPSRLTPRIVRLPYELFRHEWLMTLNPVPDSVLEEIVDDIWLPLVMRAHVRS
jgi:AcrR family transcriptional regulator